MAEGKVFMLRIITPDRVFYEGAADMVEFNTTEGQIGVLPGHIPMTVILLPGVLTIHEPESEKLAALHSGFARILPDGVTILAEIAEWPDEIDLTRAQKARDRAKERLRKKEAGLDTARAEAALRRAIARIEARH